MRPGEKLGRAAIPENLIRLGSCSSFALWSVGKVPLCYWPFRFLFIETIQLKSICPEIQVIIEWNFNNDGTEPLLKIIITHMGPAFAGKIVLTLGGKSRLMDAET